MTPASKHQAPPALIKITQRGRGGMLLTDTYVVARPVIFDMAVSNVPSARLGGTPAKNSAGTDNRG